MACRFLQNAIVTPVVVYSGTTKFASQPLKLVWNLQTLLDKFSSVFKHFKKAVQPLHEQNLIG